MQLDPKKIKKLQKIAKIIDEGDIAIAESILELEEKFEETVEKLENKIPDYKSILESVKGIDGADGITPVKGKDYFDGEDGTDYILTEKDKKDIAKRIVVPVVEKIIEKETIREVPIVTNNTTTEIVEVAVLDVDALPQYGEQYRDGLELLTEEEDKLKQSAIQNLPKDLEEIRDSIRKRTGGGSTGIKEIVAGSNITVDNTNLGYPVISSTGGGGGHTIEDEGTPLTQRTNLNFVGAGVTITDDAGNDATKVTITSGGGSGTVTEVSSANADIGVATGTTTPVLTLNSATTPTASTIVKRDANTNIFANNSFLNTTSTVSAGGTTVLTVASSHNQYLTGSSAQTYQLPDATTLALSQTFTFNNNSSQSLTVTNAGAVSQYVIPAGGAVQCFVTNIGSANGIWDFHAVAPSTVTWGSGVTGLVMNSVLNTTPAISAGASSSTSPSFIPQRNTLNTGYGGDSTHLYGVVGGSTVFTSTTGGAFNAVGAITGSNLSGTNTGDQTTIAGITGTKAQFDTAVTDGNFLYVGDVTQYTDELAQDAVGAMVDTSLVYTDGTPLLSRAALTGDITASAGSNATTLATVNSNVGSFGLAASVSQFTVNAKGLITAAANVAISITSSAVTDFASTVRATVLTGLSLVTSTAVTATDTILVAIGKLQAQNTIQDTAIALNTAKVTNATHTGDVTGSGALTIDPTAITGKTLVTAVGTDYVLISDTSDSGNLKKALASDLAGSGGVSDGDKGDITISGSGTVYTIDTNAVSFAKMQAITDGVLLGASGGTAVEEITIGTGLSLSANTLSATGGGGGLTQGQSNALFTGYAMP